ncbi:hypothetical protein NTE19_003395 [Vibrio fluvialis]|nr:hypothetical protein [Vibrio fluvialis]
MKVQAIEVCREKGFFTHPGIPLDFWGETITKEQMDAFEKENGFKVRCVFMDGDAARSFVDEWYEDGLDDCSPWEPTPPADDAFLLSIHDTEEGPVAWFAVPFAGGVNE